MEFGAWLGNELLKKKLDDAQNGCCRGTLTLHGHWTEQPGKSAPLPQGRVHVVSTSGRRLKALRQKQGGQRAGTQILGFGVFRGGCQGRKWQQDTLLLLCFLSWAILMTLPISHLTHPQCPHRHHTGWDEAYATLPRPAKEQSQLWLVISWCFSSSAQTLCPPRPEAFCTRDAIIFIH